jgi:hypothetical protein
MLQNGTEELRGQIGKARATLTRARSSGGGDARLEAPRLVGLPP